MPVQHELTRAATAGSEAETIGDVVEPHLQELEKVLGQYLSKMEQVKATRNETKAKAQAEKAEKEAAKQAEKEAKAKAKAEAKAKKEQEKAAKKEAEEQAKAAEKVEEQ